MSFKNLVATFTFAGTMIVVIWLYMILVSCSTPVKPGEIEASREKEFAAFDAQSLGGPDNSLWGLEGKIDHAGPGFISAWVRNQRPDGLAVDVFLVVYRCETGGCSVQSLVDFKVTRLDAGQSTRLSLNYDGCYQVDLGRGNEQVVLDMSWQQTIDGFVVNAGKCEIVGCPSNKPYPYPDGSCGATPPPEPPKPPQPPEPPGDEDDGDEDDDGDPPSPPEPDCICHVAAASDNELHQKHNEETKCHGAPGSQLAHLLGHPYDYVGECSGKSCLPPTVWKPQGNGGQCVNPKK